MFVAMRAPVLNLYLEDMIEQVHDMVKHIPEVRMSRYYPAYAVASAYHTGKEAFKKNRCRKPFR